MNRIFHATVLALSLAGCASVDVADYRQETPKLDFSQYFNGTVDGWGAFQDRSGRVIKRFTVRIDGTWVGNTGTLDEHFEYSDGTSDRRVWTLVKDGNRYTGSAADVIGTAVGSEAGNALRWNYVLALPVDGRTWHMDMDDWMYLIDEKTLMNRTVMSKLGFRVGDLTFMFRKR